jgi:Tfp pilus assembly protein PilN
VIRVNLLAPHTDAGIDRPAGRTATGGWPIAVLTVVLVVALAGVRNVTQSRIETLDSRITDALARQANVEREAEGVRALEARRRLLASAAAFSGRTYTSRLLVVDLLDLVRRAVPDGVSLLHLTHSTPRVTLGGRARSVRQVSDFAEALGQLGPPGLAVDVTSLSQEAADATNVAFSITLRHEADDARALLVEVSSAGSASR